MTCSLVMPTSGSFSGCFFSAWAFELLSDVAQPPNARHAATKTNASVFIMSADSYHSDTAVVKNRFLPTPPERGLSSPQRAAPRVRFRSPGRPGHLSNDAADWKVRAPGADFLEFFAFLHLRACPMSIGSYCVLYG